MAGTIWLILGIMAADVVVLELLNYLYNRRPWYVPVMFIFCNGLTVLWLWGVHVIEGDKQKVYQFSIVWEIIFVATATALPLFLGVRLNWKMFLGAVLAGVAILLIKTAGE